MHLFWTSVENIYRLFGDEHIFLCADHKNLSAFGIRNDNSAAIIGCDVIVGVDLLLLANLLGAWIYSGVIKADPFLNLLSCGTANYFGLLVSEDLLLFLNVIDLIVNVFIAF